LNKLKLKIATPEYVIYFYIPNGEGLPGEIRMNIGDKEATVISRASADNSAGNYEFKAIKAIQERVDKKIFPLEFTQAFY